ncbi:D-alanyl-D-alanine carboxypeptidase [Acinetobacter seifertii]|uniref:serine hydrolase n=1 Tax=Acinetobacter seifertii TaxID=1530123 RepID=UPI00168D158D|nr:serine hydrolase [Acinetobacter seifertii]QNX03344.1 D-alanyl-D-alanine carboxypeptidase [Acinetobacter seifertii]
MGLFELDFVKISALAEAVEVTDEDYIPIVQNGVTKKVLTRHLTEKAVEQLGSAAFVESNSFDSKGSSDAVEARAKQRDDAQNERINKLDLALYLLKNNKVYKAYKTRSLMISKKSEIPFDSLVTVADDPANNPAYDDLNGEYLWDGLNFYKLPNHILLQAKSYADGKAFEVMSNVETILYNEMVPYINDQATTAKTEAINAAATDASTKANTAKSEAITTAATDATNKANTAESNAKNYAHEEDIALAEAASIDASTKANTAKSEAITTAATDATNKANTAESNAKNYADSNANFMFKVLTEADHLDDLKVSGTYTALNTIVASTSRGYPVNEAGALRIVKHSNSNSTQHEYLTFSGKLYIRRFIASWSAWVAQATSAETDAAKTEIMGVALVNRGVVTDSAITNLTDVGLYSVSNMTDFPSDFPATFGILKRYKFGSYAYWELSSTSRPDVTWQKVGVSAWRKISLEESAAAATSAAVSKSLAVSLADKGLISGSNISDLLAVGLYAVSDMLDFPTDFPATYGILKRFKFSGYAYWELSTTSRPDIVWQKVGVAAWRKISVDDAIAPFASKDSLSLNKDKLYPVLAFTRAAVAPNLNVQALEKHILDIKVNNAKADSFYRISYYGNNSSLASDANKFGWILQEITKTGFTETGGTVKALTASATTKYEIVPNIGIVQFSLQSTVDPSISFDFTLDTTGFDQTVLYSHAISTAQAWGHIIDPLKYVLKQTVDESVIDEKIALNNKSLEALPALPVLTASAAGLVPIDLQGNADFSNLLYSKSINTAISPASVTKTMSVIVALESGMPLSNLLTVIAGDIATGSGNNLLEGDQITLLDALYNMMLPSSNTSANLVARTVGTFLGGDTATFISRMNTKASALGMANTVFKNPSGLAASGHTSTVNDLLKLGVYASKNETMESIWGQVTHTINIQGSNSRSVLIDSSVDPVVNGEPWAIGGKTGTLAPSVYNMLLFVRLRNGYTGMLVTANSTSDVDRLTDVIKIAEYSRNRFVYPAPNEITAII